MEARILAGLSEATKGTVVFDHAAIHGLYLLSREGADDRRLLAGVAAALRGGARLIQYRDKSSDSLRRQRQARALLALCREFAVPLIINDDVPLAARVGAAGVHLGEGDAELAAARAILGPDAIIGVSCYDDAGRARAAVAAGADYVAFGAFFASATKPLARQAHPDLLAATAGLGRPRVAIGGIDASNAGGLIAAGATALAVLAGVWDSPDPEAAARAISCQFPSL